MLNLLEIVCAAPRVGDREWIREALTGHQRSDYFKVAVLTDNLGVQAHSSLGCLFFLPHPELQQQSLVSWLRRHTPHILSYRLHHYGRGKRLLHVRSIAGTSLPISLIAGHNSCPRAFHLAHLHLVAVHGVEEGPCPPLLPF